MNRTIDAYHEWLGIPPEEQPPNHYRLLGLRLFEDNKEVISNAAARQMKYLRTLAVSEHVDLAQKLLNEVAEAKVCLWDAAKKASYDARLRGQVEDSRRAATLTLPGAPVGFVPPASGGGALRPPAAPEPTGPAATPAPSARAAQPQPPSLPSPAPPSPPAARPPSPVAGNALRTWTIGSAAECDIVVTGDAVSRRHCRLSQTEEGFFLEDLKSTNGTFVNNSRIHDATLVHRRDRITLGRKIPLPWPADILPAPAGIRPPPAAPHSRPNG